MSDKNPTDEDLESIERAARLLDEADSVLFITGAGVSAESGLPTYRGVGGIYNETTTDEGIPIEEALSGRMMRDNPAITWKYLLQIDRATKGKKPNLAHFAIARIGETKRRVWVLTQNVDGFHREAGSKNVIEIHGNLHTIRCTRCSYHSASAAFSIESLPPLCPECGAVLRPDVVLFGEMLDDANVRTLTREMETGFDLIFSVGTTSVFPYIAGPVQIAARKGKPTVEINPSYTEVSDIVTLKISAPAGVALGKILERLQTDG